MLLVDWSGIYWASDGDGYGFEAFIGILLAFAEYWQVDTRHGVRDREESGFMVARCPWCFACLRGALYGVYDFERMMISKGNR